VGTKSQKMALSKAVVERLHNDFSPPGRFLKKDPETGLWVELTLKEAAGKTAQAFAYAKRDRARQNNEEEQYGERTEEVTTKVSGTKRPASPSASSLVVEGRHPSALALNNHEREGARKRKKSMGTNISDQTAMQQQPQPQLHHASAATVANSDATLLALIRSSQQNNQSLQNLFALQELVQQQQTQQEQAQLAQAILNAQQHAHGLQPAQSLLPSSQGTAHSAAELLLRRMLLQSNPQALSQRELQLQGLLLQSNPLALTTEQLQLQDLLRNSLQNQSILSLGGGFNNQQVLLPRVQPNLQQIALMQQVNTIAEFLRRQQDNNNNGEQKQG